MDKTIMDKQKIKKPFTTVIIKTYNEENGIEKTLKSIHENAKNVDYKVIVADSLSGDKTQEIALANGATVVSLVNPADRCCGVGHQLGYLHSEGDYLLLLDGDMELEAGFLESSLDFLENNPEYAGVAGAVEMDDASSYEFQARKQKLHLIYPFGDSPYLAGGGLYRKSAIDKIGYLTNKNLHAMEEAELGMRLRSAGFKLHRLDIPYFSHTSYTLSSLELLKFRWKSLYLCAPGELLRTSLGKPYFKDVLINIKNEAIFGLYLLFLLIVAITAKPLFVAVAIAPLLAFIVLKTIKNRSMVAAFYSVLTLSFFVGGLVRGFFRPNRDPMKAPENKVINKENI